MAQCCGMPLGEFLVLENIRAFLGHPAAFPVTSWDRDAGAVIAEMPEAELTAPDKTPAP